MPIARAVPPSAHAVEREQLQCAARYKSPRKMPIAIGIEPAPARLSRAAEAIAGAGCACGYAAFAAALPEVARAGRTGGGRS